MSERLSTHSRTIMATASYLARGLGHESVATHHLLYGLAHETGTASVALHHFGMTPAYLLRRIIRKLGQQESTEDSATAFTQLLNETIQRAADGADRLSAPEVTERHLLQAILDGPHSAAQYEIERKVRSLDHVRKFLSSGPEADNDFLTGLQLIVVAGTKETATDFERGAAHTAQLTIKHLRGTP